MTERYVNFVLLGSDDVEAVVLRVDFEDHSPSKSYVFEDRAKLDRLLLALGLRLSSDSSEIGHSQQVTPGQLRDLLEYSECPYPCCNADCRCFHHA